MSTSKDKGMIPLLDFLDELPAASDSYIVIEGLLIGGHQGCCKIITEYVGFELDIDDIVSVQELSFDPLPRYGIPIVLHLKKGAKLLDVFPADCYQDFWNARRPFAVSVRPTVCQVPIPARFRALEDQFFRRHSP